MKKSLFPALAIVAMTLLPAAASAVTVTTDIDGTLVKSSEPAVYFYGSDHKRYVFPNDKIFFTWYSDFSSVQTVTDEELAAMPIGGNVTYRPGTKLIKITTDPKVYAVSGGGILRWIMSEELAKSLYGDDWAKQVQDVADGFFANYQMGETIEHTDSFNPETERNAFNKIIHDIEAKSDPSTIPLRTEAGTSSTHSVVLTSQNPQEFSWTDSEVSPLGYKFVWSKTEHPTYPAREGDSFFYLPESSTKSARIFKLEPGTYYVRICVYLGGRCGAYSNEVMVTKSTTEVPGTKPTTTPTSTRMLLLSSLGNGYFAWMDNVSSTQGYKLVWSKSEHPTYPMTDSTGSAEYAAADRQAGKITVEPGTYYVRVCVYTNEGCMVYSNQLKFVKEGSTTPAPTTSSTHTIVLTSKGAGEFSWTNSDTTPRGYRLLWSKNENPTYPPRTADNGTTITTLSGKISIDPGTYYVRICEYTNDGCSNYSNQVTFIKEAANVITLTSAGNGYFFWTNTATSTNPYKLVWSKTENPTYPLRSGDSGTLISTPYGTISVEAGTYYVRVCEYVDGSCGVYSNQVSYTKAAEVPTTPVARAINLIHYDNYSFIWTDTATTTNYALLWSLNENPTYPMRNGDYSFLTTTNYAGAYIDPGFYYARVCGVAVTGGMCDGPYSNQVTFSRTASTTSALR